MADQRNDSNGNESADREDRERQNAKQGSSGAGRGQLDDAEESQVDEDRNLSGASTWETLNGRQTNLQEEERARPEPGGESR
ncbi:MAG TPA: hypothetical protein VJU87_05130 [Gemmatimonadaceae bacterium]|nr:hypothetical protein [Gemmatimonadaceae bacterium]